MEERKINPEDFDYAGIQLWLPVAEQIFSEKQDYPIEPICKFLFEFTKVFKKMGKLLNMAFSDVSEKVEILRLRSHEYKEELIFKIIEQEIQQKIHQMNGENNKQINKDKKYEHYVSAARTLLRMMWFMNYLIIMFSEICHKKTSKISDCCLKAYDEAFSKHHAFYVKIAAHAAMVAAPNRQKILLFVSEPGKSDQFAYDNMENIISLIIPIRDKLWEYYNQHKLTELP